MKYRAEIDGLRAVAVIPVLLYHANIRPFTGGFVGVDIFFVISGYLIATLIFDEIQQGRFSIVYFYERRIRRIFPALFAVIFFSFIVAFFLFMPFDFKRFGASAVAITMFASNVLFWLTSGYFDAGSDLKPLLHTWSLAVEEQYYLFFPIFLAVIGGSKKWSILLTTQLMISSFAFSVWQVVLHPTAAFYLPPSRVWELFLGAVLALWKPLGHGRLFDEVLGTLGLGLILVSILTFTPKTSFPGVNALLPCLGAALVIYAGANRDIYSLRFLRTRIFVFGGQISYSLYLWHWPMIVFAKYYLMRELNALETLFVLVLSTLSAVASWRFIEAPFRSGGSLSKSHGRVLFGSAAAVMAVSLIGGFVVYLSEGLPGRFPGDVRSLAMGAFDTKVGKSKCDRTSAHDIRTGRPCEIGDLKATDPTFAVFGDSYAVSLLPAIEATANNAQQRGVVLTRGGCYPLVGIKQGDEACAEFNRASIEFINAHPSITSVIVIGRWTSAAEGTRYGAEHVSEMYIADSYSGEPSYDENRKVFTRAVDRTIRSLPGKSLFVVVGIPEQKINVPRTAALGKYFGRDVKINVSRAEFDERQRFVKDVFANASKQSEFAVLDASKLLCTEYECLATIGARSLYSDDNHLGEFGAMYIRRIFEPTFSSLSK